MLAVVVSYNGSQIENDAFIFPRRFRHDDIELTHSCLTHRRVCQLDVLTRYLLHMLLFSLRCVWVSIRSRDLEMYKGICCKKLWRTPKVQSSKAQKSRAQRSGAQRPRAQRLKGPELKGTKVQNTKVQSSKAQSPKAHRTRCQKPTGPEHKGPDSKA